MAHTPLATTDDLDARGIDSTFSQVDTLLEVASSEVRQAAGAPISQVTSTVTLAGYLGELWIKLPGGPVTDVDTVTVDGDAETDYRRSGDFLWRAQGWAKGFWPGRPSEVEVTYTHGLTEVPAHIVDLVCSMVAAGKVAIDSDDDGAGLAMTNGKIQSETIDNYSITYATSGGSATMVTAMTLPEGTRRRLAAEFGGGASVLVSR